MALQMDDLALREPSLKQKTKIKRWSHCERGQEGDSRTVSPVQNSIQNTQTNHSIVSSSEVSARCLEEVHSVAALHVLLMSMLTFNKPKTNLIIVKFLSLSILTKCTSASKTHKILRSSYTASVLSVSSLNSHSRTM